MPVSIPETGDKFSHAVIMAVVGVLGMERGDWRTLR